MTSSWVARGRGPGGRPGGAGGRGHGRGQRVLLGRQHVLDRQRAGRHGRPAADRMLPFYRAWLSIRRLEVPTIAAINGPAIGAGLAWPSPATSGTPPRARLGGPVRQARDARRAWRHLPAAGRGRAGRRARPAAHRPARRRRRGAAPRPGLAGDRPRRLPRPGPRDRRRGDRGHRADREPADQDRAGCGGHADFDACLEWEALAQPVTLATADLQEGIRAAQEKRAPGSTAGEWPLVHEEEAPGSTLPPLAFPLRTAVGRPGGPICAQR